MCLACINVSIDGTTTVADIVNHLQVFGVSAHTLYVYLVGSASEGSLRYRVSNISSYNNSKVCALLDGKILTSYDGEPGQYAAVAGFCESIVNYLLFTEGSMTALECWERMHASEHPIAAGATTSDVVLTTNSDTAASVKGTNRDDILIGYELETDSWEGSLDEDAYDNAISDWIDSNMPDTTYFGAATINRIREDLSEAAVDNVDSADYQNSWDDISSELSGFDAHRDATVNGPEIVLSNPQGIDKAKDMTDRLFAYIDEHGAEINKGCSFHIHLSVQGRKHTYGSGLQALMVDYVFQQALAGRLPTRLLDRWCNGSLSDYFHLDLNSEKYNFVAHRHYGGYATWEFRCFGNIDNAEDAKECIDVAVEAYCWAYAMIQAHGSSSEACKRVFDTESIERIRRILQGELDDNIEEQLTRQRNAERATQRREA